MGLSRDYHFYWNASTRNQRAYNAVTTHGNTSDFSYMVWDSLVSNLKAAMDECRISWDDTYGTYQQTLALLPYAELTAKRFNAVRLNVGKYIQTTWKWAYDPTFEGFVGRENMLGVSAVGEQNADTVYGTYILELVRKYNVLIDILSDEASFAQFVSRLTATMQAESANLGKIPTVQLNIDALFESIFDSTLTTAETYLLTANARAGTSYTNKAQMELEEAGESMESHLLAKTSFAAEMSLEDLYKNLVAYLAGSIRNTARLAVSANKAILSTQTVNHSFNEATIEFALTCNMVLSLLCEADQTAILTKAVPIGIVAYTNCLTFGDDRLQPTPPRYLIVDETFASSNDTEMELMNGRQFIAVLTAMLRQTKSTITRTVAQKAVAAIPIIASAIAEGSVDVSLPLNTITDALVGYDCTLLNDPVSALVVDAQYGTGESATIYPGRADAMNTVTHAATGNNSSIEVLHIRQLNAAHNILAVIASAANAKENKAMISTSVSHESAVAFLQNYDSDDGIEATLDTEALYVGLLDALDADDTMEVVLINEIAEAAALAYLQPTGINAVMTGSEQFELDMELLDAEDTIPATTIDESTSDEAILERVRFIAFESEIESRLTHEATADFDPSSWLNPVQEGNKLFIYQVYDAQQEAGELQLDLEETT